MLNQLDETPKLYNTKISTYKQMSMHLKERIAKQLILHTQNKITQILNINYSESNIVKGGILFNGIDIILWDRQKEKLCSKDLPDPGQREDYY